LLEGKIIDFSHLKSIIEMEGKKSIIEEKYESPFLPTNN
jgi:hypothetical protein